MKRKKKPVRRRPQRIGPPPTKEIVISISERWRALVEGRPTQPIDVMCPDAGFYEAQIGPLGRRTPIPARVIVRRTVFVDTGASAEDDKIELWLDGERIHENPERWLYWKAVPLRRYKELQAAAKTTKVGQAKRINLKDEPPII